MPVAIQRGEDRMPVLFPATCRPAKYYDIHVRYVVESARAAGAEVAVIGEASPLEDGRFEVIVDGRTTLFDFDDFPALTPAEVRYEHVFKFHTEDHHPPNVHAFPVVSFYDWSRYQILQEEIHYGASGGRVICRQRPYCGAKVRRTRVQRLLREAYGQDALTRILPQEQYLREVGNCLTHVFVPGARNDMLDRAMAQWLAFGACVVAPPIRTLLPFGERLTAGVHFVECRPDYADLIDRIEWCRSHREACRGIGVSAKELFQRCCIPQAAWAWVRRCLESEAVAAGPPEPEGGGWREEGTQAACLGM